MTMFYECSIPPMNRALGALSAVLTKAEAHCTARKIDPEALLKARLFPDMFTLTKQVQLACDYAARGAARLAGADLPGFPDTETSFAELQIRISRTRDYLGTFQADRFADAAGRSITLKQRGADLVLPGTDFLTLYALPNFYFHTATAY
ncbi:MAG TPA: DUF1993 domain-containing protein, partial [Paracoccaceae bacterium]